MCDLKSIVTYNVNGIRDERKRREVFNYLHHKKFRVMLLQETHSIKQDEKYWATTWGSKIWYDHGGSNTKGVAILIAKEIPITVHTVVRSEIGRYILMYISYKNVKILFANIYAPNEDNRMFFTEVFDKIEQFSPNYYIIGGDFNLGIEKSIDRYGAGSNNDKSAEWIRNHLENNQYVDIWRQLNPDLNGFTWHRLRPKPTYSRLDYLIVSEPFVQFVEGVKILPGFQTDHSIVEMRMNFDHQVRGPGYWKFNVNLLHDQDYINKINQLLEIELEKVVHGEYRKHWEVIKLAVRGSTIQFASRRKKANKNKVEILEKKLRRLEKELVNKSVFSMILKNRSG